MIRYLVQGILAAALCLSYGPVAAQSLTPTALEIHGPDKVFELSSADFTAVVTWSDGTKSRQTPAWSTSNTSVATITLGGMLMTQSVATITPVTVQAQFSSLIATKPIAVLDASSLPTVSYTLAPGWNLLGNTIASPISVSDYFGNVLQQKPGISDRIISVWKWNAATQKWSFFSPGLTPAELELTTRGSVLRVIFPGDGFWVNTLPFNPLTAPLTLPARTASPVLVSSSGLVKGWNLIATAQPTTPSGFNYVVAGTPPRPPESAPDTPSGNPFPVSFVSLWVRDAAPTNKWICYFPSVEATSGLDGVKLAAEERGCLDFTTHPNPIRRTLGHGIGYWVNVLPTNTNPSSNLAPIGQAKAMISELRTTIRGYTNDLKTGFLDAQSTRIRNDLQNNVAPDLQKVHQAVAARMDAMKLFEDIWKGNTTSYASSINATDGTVSAVRMWTDGTYNLRCFSNPMAGSVVTKNLLTDVTCRRFNTDFFAWTYNPTFTSRTQVHPLVKISPDTGQAAPSSLATPPDSYGYKWETWKATRTEISSNGFTTVSSSSTSAAITPIFLGTFSRTYLAGTTNLSGFSMTGDINATDSTYHHNTLTVTGTRAVDPDAAPGAGLYRYSVTGSVASKTAEGATMVTWDLASGSYYVVKEETNGNPLANSLQAVHAVGTAQTSASRFTGTLDVNAFVVDAGNLMYSPTSLRFNGTVEDLSSVAGTFLTGLFTLTHNNLASYNSGLPESALNFEKFDASFTGTINAPSRPVLSLTFGASRTTGPDTFDIVTTYSYGTVSVTGIGTVDNLNDANNILTLTNQDGIKVTFQPHADAVISKCVTTPCPPGIPTTLGIIPLGSSIIYYIDGYFESL